MRLLDAVVQLAEDVKEVVDEDGYIRWVRRWKRVHENVVNMIDHHKGIMNFHLNEWNARKQYLRTRPDKESNKPLATFTYAFNDENVDEGVRRSSQRWKDIYGNVARELYENRATGKEWIREYYKTHDSRFSRAKTDNLPA